MTLEKLEQLISLREEIEEIKDAIVDMETGKGNIISDKVQSSMRDFPYTRVMVNIRGFDIKPADKGSKRLHRKRILLRCRKTQCEELEMEITEYINRVPDSEIRRILDYKYVKGYTWERIGEILHADRTTVKRKILKYISQENSET